MFFVRLLVLAATLSVAKLSMKRTKERKLTGTVEPKHTLISTQEPSSGSYLQKSFPFSIQPYQLALVVRIATITLHSTTCYNRFAAQTSVCK